MTEPPPGLAALEQHVIANDADADAFLVIDRAIVRALLAYVHQLERETERLAAAVVAEGCFW